MKYKLIISDFDGTLLSDDFTVSAENSKAIKKYISRGGNFIVSTGRMASSIYEWKEYLGISNQPVPVIGFNGALITGKNGEVIKSTCIDAKTAIAIVKKAMEMNIYHHIYDNDSVYVSSVNKINYDYAVITGAPLKVVGRLDTYLEKHPDMLIPKIMLVIDLDKRSEIEAEFDAMGLTGVKHVHSGENYFEFINENAGKENALSSVAEILGIRTDEVIAIGDSQNDAKMLMRAGLGVAVLNAAPEAQSVADYITPVSNNQSAIAHVIEKFGE